MIIWTGCVLAVLFVQGTSLKFCSQTQRSQLLISWAPFPLSRLCGYVKHFSSSKGLRKRIDFPCKIWARSLRDHLSLQLFQLRSWCTFLTCSIADRYEARNQFFHQASLRSCLQGWILFSWGLFGLLLWCGKWFISKDDVNLFLLQTSYFCRSWKH